MRAQALLLAWKGSGCKLNGPTVGVTDEQGHVHFDLSFASGSSGSYLLLFGSEATFAFGGIADGTLRARGEICTVSARQTAASLW